MGELDTFWRAMFGEAISDFEEMLVMKGARVMTPEEPLYSVFVMMVRVLHQSQGETEKALLRFAPELASRAQLMISALDGLERRLTLLQQRADEFSTSLRILETGSVTASPLRAMARRRVPTWVQQNIGPIATTALAVAFCTGFVIASYVYAS